jgi:hypothetical protein
MSALAPGRSEQRRPEQRPPHPWRILALAVLLPGWGHWRLGKLQRGVAFVFFIAILGWITWRLAPAERSLVGRAAGGLFVYAISAMDAYQLARLRFERWKQPPAAR